MRVLITTIEGGGNIPPVLHLVRRLAAKGHSVSVLSEPCLQQVLTEAGAAFIPFPEYFTKTDRNHDMFEDWKSKNNGFDKVIFGPASIVAKATRQVLESQPFDLLIADVLLPGALSAGELNGIPSVLLFHMPEYLPGKNRPPGGLGLVPGRGLLGHWRDRLLGKVFQLVFDQYRPALNAIRKEWGMPLLQHTTDVFYRADLRLIQTSRAFDFPLDPAPANVRYTGAVLDDPDWAQGWQSPWPEQDKRPLVVVSLSSTFQNQKKALDQCIQALGKLPVRGLVTLGPAMAGESFDLPANVKTVEQCSHAAVFPQASALITHAGHGTVMKALVHGLPMVCLPMGRDQDDNAAKVAYHGAGIALSAGSGAHKIAKAVEEVLTESQYRAKVAALGQLIVEESRNSRLVEELEALVGDKKH